MDSKSLHSLIGVGCHVLLYVVLLTAWVVGQYPVLPGKLPASLPVQTRQTQCRISLGLYTIVQCDQKVSGI